MKRNSKWCYSAECTIATVLLISIFNISSIAQISNSSLDTMIFEMNTMKSDTHKVKALFEIVKMYRRIQLDSALQYGLKELTLSKELNYHWGIGKASNQIAMILQSNGRSKESYDYFLSAIKSFEVIRDLDNRLTVLSNMGKYFNAQPNTDSSKKYIHKALLLNLNTPDSLLRIENEIDLLNDLAIMYYIADKLDSVIYFNNRVIEKAKVLNLNEFIGSAYLSNAAAYQKLRNQPKAIEDLRWADLYLPEAIYKIQIYAGFCTSFYGIGQYDSVLVYSNKALKLCEELGDKTHIPLIQLNLGLAYNGKKDPINALKYFKDCIQNEQTNRTDKGQSYQFGAESYSQLMQHGKAIEFLNKALSTLDTSDHNRRNQVYNSLSDEFYILGRYKESRDMIELALIEDKLFITAQHRSNIDELEVKFQTALKQEEITRLSKENEIQDLQIQNKNQQKNLAIISFLGLGLFGGLGFYRFKEKKSQENKNALLNERLRLSSELHDEVGSTLSGISMYSHLAQSQLRENNEALKTSLETIQNSSNEIVNKLSDIIWITNPEKDSLPKLREKLEDYLRKMSSIKNIHVNIVENTNGHLIPISDTIRKNIYLIMKEAVNNAVKYSGATEIKFICLLEKNSLKIGIEDNGKGFDVHASKGNGLQNMTNRAKELNASLVLESGENGSKVLVAVKI